MEHAFLCAQERNNLIKMQFKHLIQRLNFWRENKKGTTAIEFSLAGVPFILMIIGILEMSLMFTAQNLLESSTNSAARLIRTGQVQQGGGESAFSDAVCDLAGILIPCGDIQYQVLPLDDFGAAEDLPDAAFDEEGNLEEQGFDPGGVSDVVIIRVAYKYPIKTPLMQFLLSNNNDSNRLMISTIVLQTEPYEFEEG